MPSDFQSKAVTPCHFPACEADREEVAALGKRSLEAEGNPCQGKQAPLPARGADKERSQECGRARADANVRKGTCSEKPNAGKTKWRSQDVGESKNLETDELSRRGAREQDGEAVGSPSRKRQPSTLLKNAKRKRLRGEDQGLFKTRSHCHLVHQKKE